MHSLLLFTLLSSFLFHSAYACGAGGIGGPTSGALIALCVVLLPVIIPVAAVGGTGYLAYAGIKKGANAINKKQRNKKRNSDIIKTQMSRAVKLVGKDKFQAHIQSLYDQVVASGESEVGLRACFDLGVALFLNRDLLGADEYLSTVINRDYLGNPYLAHAYFVRGLVNQYLFAFKLAAKDFQHAIKLFEEGRAKIEVAELNGADSSAVPRLTAFDAHNSYGFACALQALFAEEDNNEKVRLLDIAINEYNIALDGVEIKQGMWFHNRGVARYFRTYYQANATPQSIHNDLELALADFVSAISSGNFGTAADGYAMAAQTCTRLKKPKDQIDAFIEKAYEADPKVFMVDVNDELELSVPWPLPRHEYPFKKSPHQFEKVHFNKPTWCNHCMGFIQNPVGKQGYECLRCKYHVHSKCFPQVKAKSCWSEAREDSTTMRSNKGALATHVHHFKGVHFGKPTWCDHCKKFVSNPIGKQGYKCADCKMKIHKECVNDVIPNLVED